MIGLSFTACVGSILKGNVKIEDVSKVISGIKAVPGTDDWNRLMNEYADIYWRGYSDEQINSAITQVLRITEFPRWKKDTHFPLITHGYWVENEANIKWNDRY